VDELLKQKLAREMTHWNPVQSERPLADMWAGMNNLQRIGMLPVPVVSDAAGLLGDIQMYRERPETRGLLNYSMSGLGLLPFVPGALGVIGHAKAGGEIAAANGYFYKGGQFLPSTAAEPGRWKVEGKWIKSGKAEIGPREYAHQPTPFSRSIYELIAGVSERDHSGQLQLRRGITDALGASVTPDALVRPGVKGVLGKESLTLQEFIDAYNAGLRWFDVKPLGETVTTLVDAAK
jgi:hypothetical protein